MTLPFAPFKALALSIAAIILALTPISTLIFWVESGSEVIYSSLAYTIVYKPNVLNAITGFNETRVKVEVKDGSGRPLAFAALLSGPTSNGAIEVGKVSGKGYGVKAIGSYVSEVKKVLREANSDPESSGMGMLILISTIIEENGEYYAAADAVSVPIVPGKAVGKDIVVSVRFKPIMKYKVRGGENSGEYPQGPPGTITNYCVHSPQQRYCYVWELDQVLYTTPQPRLISGEQVAGWDYIPVFITELTSPRLIDKTSDIEHIFSITLSQTKVKYVRFSMSLGWSDESEVSVYVPGDSYVKEIEKESTLEWIYEIGCRIYSTSSSDQSSCNYLVSKDGTFKSSTTSKFTGDVLFSTGFRGRLWLVNYKYVEVSSGGYEIVLNDKVLAIWIEPVFNVNGMIIADWEVDDYPGDNWGITENVLKKLKSNTSYVKIRSGTLYHYALPIGIIYVQSQASEWFGAGIPVGALILALAGITDEWIVAIAGLLAIGINGGSEEKSTPYIAAGLFAIKLKSASPIDVYFAKFTNPYEIKMEAAKKAVPLIIFKPV
ncbi:MAG: hypothetical protein P3X22_000285 [Thermoprotei archaeon]|nr:hypothetical protein [Thermoprotei archaeon]